MHTFNTFCAKWFRGTNFHQTVNFFTRMENVGVSMAVSFHFFSQIIVVLIRASALTTLPALCPLSCQC